MNIEQMMNRRFFAPADDAGAGAAAGAAEAEAAAAEAAAAEDKTAAGSGEGGATAAAEDDKSKGGKGWWEEESITPEARDFLTKKGMLQGTATEALLKTIRTATGAEARLGKPADAILDRPGKDQKLSEYFRANAEAFGLPDSAEGYELGDLELPENIPLDEKLTETARAIAFEEGLPPAAFQRLTKAYADRIGEIVGDEEATLKKAQIEMRTQLQKDWGPQMDAKMAGAQQAAAFVAEAAGLDAVGLQNVSQLLARETGDAQVIKMFAAIAESMGEDTLAGVNAGDSGLGLTPVDARAKIEELNDQIAKADKAGDKAEVARLRKKRKPLFKIAG